MGYRWLLFCPQLPSTPSSPRVLVWRRMRMAGSVGLDNGIWALPHSSEAQTFIREMQSYVQSQGGTSRVFVAEALDSHNEEAILARFREARAQEYEELDEECERFLADLVKETECRNYSFAEYEENERDLDKLEVWLARVQKRDFLPGSQAEHTASLLEQCRQALQAFATRVFDHEERGQADGQADTSTGEEVS